MFLAHIAGVPIEETALALAPVAAATGGLAGLKLRRLSGIRRRARARSAGVPRRQR